MSWTAVDLYYILYIICPRLAPSGAGGKPAILEIATGCWRLLSTHFKMNLDVDETISVDEDNNNSLPKCCPLCKIGFDKIVPKLLPCLHSFCQPCLESRLNEQREQPQSSLNETTRQASTASATTSRLKCPKCGQEFLVPSRGIPSLIDNQFVLEAVSKPSGESETELHVCTSCEDNSSSTSYCLNCTEWLCDACVQAHQRVRVTKDHEIKSREELKESLKNQGRTERALFCQKHPSEKLKLFCANCERLTCRDCQLLEHKDHKYQFVNEAAVRYRDAFRKRLEILREKIGPLAESIEAVQNSAKHLDHKADVVANEIKVSSLDIIKAVKQRESVLLNELKALVHFKRKMLTKQSKDLRLMQEILSHNYEFAKHAVMQGSDVSLLYSKKQLGSRIQNLLSLKYRVTPVAHSDLKFVTEAVKLCNSILKTGSVMTPSTPRSSVSPGTGLPQRGSNMMSHRQNGPHTNSMKANPLHSLDTFNNRQIGGILPGNPMVANSNYKPSSKVYPNVISSHMSMPVMSNGILSSSIPFLNSPAIHNPQVRVLPKPINPLTSPLTAGVSTTTTFYSSAPKLPGASPMRMVPQPDGSVIPLHHIENGSKNLMRESPPSYDKSVSSVRQSPSSLSAMANSSSQTPQQGNGFSTTSRDVRRDSSLTTHGIDHTPFVHSSSPKPNQHSPSIPQHSPSPMSPSLPKPSPNPSQTSLSPPQVSPKPLASPRSSQFTSSPLPSPLPTFLESDPPYSLPTGVKVKVEKDPLSPEAPCSEVKQEPKCYSACGVSLESSTITNETSTFAKESSAFGAGETSTFAKQSSAFGAGETSTFAKQSSAFGGEISTFAKETSAFGGETSRFLRESSASGKEISTCSKQTNSFGPPSNNSSNEDWCAVCHNGGELLCCDTCPKVFHLLCHVPTLTTTPSDTWSCGLCQSLDSPSSKASDGTSGVPKRRAPIGGMSERNTKVCEKMLLELFCHPDSVPFHEKVSKAVPNYYKVIQRPMDLSSIKTKLQPMHFDSYSGTNEFIADCKLIFANCALFNDTDSEVGKMGKRLAVDFQDIIHKYLPRYEENNDEPRTKRRKDDIV